MPVKVVPIVPVEVVPKKVRVENDMENLTDSKTVKLSKSVQACKSASGASLAAAIPRGRCECSPSRTL